MQLFFFCYHKVGTVLIGNIVKKISKICRMSEVDVLGLATHPHASKQIVKFSHSLIGFDLAKTPHRGVRIVRDPREIWVSGYLYHRRCKEPWCINTNFSAASPITFPRVPWSQQHRSEQWKGEYLAGLGGRSYQDNLNAMDSGAGLAFELERYADWTISAMDAWVPDGDTIDIRIEDFMSDFDATLTRILVHCGFGDRDIGKILAAAQSEDISRMSDKAIASNRHIFSRDTSKWQSMLTPDQVARIEDRFGDVINKLGYARQEAQPSGVGGDSRYAAGSTMLAGAGSGDVRH